MSPLVTVKASSRTLTMGTKQLVVHEALEMTVWTRRIELVIIDPNHEGGVGVAGGTRDDDELGAAFQVGGRIGSGRESSR